MNTIFYKITPQLNTLNEIIILKSYLFYHFTSAICFKKYSTCFIIHSSGFLKNLAHLGDLVIKPNDLCGSVVILLYFADLLFF